MKKVVEFNRLLKQEYQKPQMKAVTIQQSQVICTSPGVKSLDNTEGFTLQELVDDDDV